jgi:ribosomal protein L14
MLLVGVVEDISGVRPIDDAALECSGRNESSPIRVVAERERSAAVVDDADVAALSAGMSEEVVRRPSILNALRLCKMTPCWRKCDGERRSGNQQ